MAQFKIGDEVQNPEGSVSGLVYNINEREDGIWYRFIDEHGFRYTMQEKDLKPANYITAGERDYMMRRYKHLFKRSK